MFNDFSMEPPQCTALVIKERERGVILLPNIISNIISNLISKYLVNRFKLLIQCLNRVKLKMQFLFSQ